MTKTATLTQKIIMAVTACILLNFVLVVGVTAYQTDSLMYSFNVKEMGRTSELVNTMVKQVHSIEGNTVPMDYGITLSALTKSNDDYVFELRSLDQLQSSPLVQAIEGELRFEEMGSFSQPYIINMNGQRIYTSFVPVDTVSISASEGIALSQTMVTGSDEAVTSIIIQSEVKEPNAFTFSMNRDPWTLLARNNSTLAQEIDTSKMNAPAVGISFITPGVVGQNTFSGSHVGRTGHHMSASATANPVMSSIQSIPLSDSVLIVSKPFTGLSEHSLHIIRNAFIAMLLVSLPTIGLLAMLLQRVTKPIIAMSIAAEAIADEQFDQTIEAPSHDEIGQLALSLTRMARQLKQNNASREAFLASISHELRTPLTTLKANTQGILDGVIGEEEIPEFLDSNMEEINRLGGMVDELILASRLQHTQELDKEHICVAELLDSVIAQMRIYAKRQHIELQAELDPGLVIYADKTKLRQVFINIIDNAVKHSPPYGVVDISCSRSPEHPSHIQVRVCDQGQGIAPEDQAHVFDQFYHDQHSAGLGLGLYISQQIVHAHNGTIQAMNRLEGGACFVISLDG